MSETILHLTYCLACKMAARHLGTCLLASALGFASGMEATAKDDVPRIHPVQCPNGKAIDPYPVWSEVENTNQAKLFLRGQFNKIGDVDNFAIWLSCQSFIVRVMPANKPNPLNSTRLIIGSFMASGAGRDTLWDGRLLRFPPIYSTSVYLYLDDLNNFLSVEIEYTVQ